MLKKVGRYYRSEKTAATSRPTEAFASPLLGLREPAALWCCTVWFVLFVWLCPTLLLSRQLFATQATPAPAATPPAAPAAAPPAREPELDPREPELEPREPDEPDEPEDPEEPPPFDPELEPELELGPLLAPPPILPPRAPPPPLKGRATVLSSIWMSECSELGAGTAAARAMAMQARAKKRMLSVVDYDGSRVAY